MMALLYLGQQINHIEFVLEFLISFFDKVHCWIMSRQEWSYISVPSVEVETFIVVLLIRPHTPFKPKWLLFTLILLLDEALLYNLCTLLHGAHSAGKESKENQHDFHKAPHISHEVHYFVGLEFSLLLD